MGWALGQVEACRGFISSGADNQIQFLWTESQQKGENCLNPLIKRSFGDQRVASNSI